MIADNMKGMNVFFENPGEVKERKCLVCGTICDVKRNVLGATGWAEAMAKLKSLHDHFSCPYSGKSWHNKAMGILCEAEETESLVLSSLMKKEAEQIVKIGLQVNKKAK